MYHTAAKTERKHPIHAYVRADVRGKFERYWQGVGLTSGSALLTLLILREVQIKRLAVGVAILPGPDPRSSKVSAYVAERHCQSFRSHSEALGRTPSDCAAVLIEQELDEQWLKTALGMTSGAAA